MLFRAGVTGDFAADRGAKESRLPSGPLSRQVVVSVQDAPHPLSSNLVELLKAPLDNHPVSGVVY